MTIWLVDASVLLACEDADDEHHDDARASMAGADPVATLDLACYEVANVAVRAWHDLAAADRLSDRIDAIADDGGIVRADPPLPTDAVALADHHGISVDDAAYAAAAQRLDARLVSCDVRGLVARRLAILPGAAAT